SLLVRAWLAPRRDRRAAPSRQQQANLVPLRAVAGDPAFGGKASRLGQLLVQGFPVPDGFAVPAGRPPGAAELAAAFPPCGGGPAAGRSSAGGGEGARESHAGEFKPVRGAGREGLAAAIAAVRASYGARRGSVVIQPMVPAERAGVMFTEDPAHAGRVLVES